MNEIIKTQEYFHWINDLKSKIHAAQTKVALTINSQLYPFVPQSAAQIPWGHNRLIFQTKLPGIEELENELRKEWKNQVVIIVNMNNELAQCPEYPEKAKYSECPYGA